LRVLFEGFLRQGKVRECLLFWQKKGRRGAQEGKHLNFVRRNLKIGRKKKGSAHHFELGRSGVLETALSRGKKSGRSSPPSEEEEISFCLGGNRGGLPG